MKLRYYQKEALDACKTELSRGLNRQLIRLPTAMGKTPMFSSIPDHLGLQRRVMVLAHTEELIDQARDKIKVWNPNRSVGVEMAERRSNGEDIVVASVASIGRAGGSRLAQFKAEDFDAIICDESHRSTASSYMRVFEHFKLFESRKRLLVGVTATTKRSDGIGLNNVYQKIIYSKSIVDGIREGYLVDIRGIRISTGLSLDDIHIRAGDFDLAEMADRFNTPTMNELAVKSWIEHGKDRQTIGFTIDVQHAKDLAALFGRYGIAAQAVWGGDPDRAFKIDCLRTGSIKVLLNCQLLVEGFDCWQVGCILFTRPTQSELFFTQALGRGTRIPENLDNLVDARKQGLHIAKQDCILLDLVHATKKHSLMTLPSLLGLNKDLDMRGKSVLETMTELESVQAANSATGVEKAKDLSKLRSYAKEVDLFGVQPHEETLARSKFQWRKVGGNGYVLLLPKDDHVTVLSDLRGRWHIVGKIKGRKIKDLKATFSAALREADDSVEIFGGASYAVAYKTTAKWHKDGPTAYQISLCGRLNIVIPEGATKGEVSLKIAERFGVKRTIGLGDKVT